ncbi:MAG: hypothetical protein P4L86_31935 [Mycobacterium sp.]|nr:hypothetical protein [Mycobacterium sp.]
MDVVLGVSMAPASVQMVLLQGENADGATVDENEFAVTAADDSPTVSASDRVVAAILGTREDAAGAGLELSSVGVACTDQLEAAALRDALDAHKIENVMLVSAFLAATALTQFVGGAMGYERTAMLFVEPGTATLAVVETSDGSIADVHEEQLDSASGQVATAELMGMVAGLDELPARPGGLFVVGRGVDIAPFKPHLEEATSLTVNAPEEPETALARGAALASANAPLFASSTAALAYAQDLGTGAVDVSALPEYLSITGAELGEDDLAYSAVADDEAVAPTVVINAGPGAPGESEPPRRPGLLVGTAVAVATFSAALALEIALSLGIRTTVGLLPAPVHDLIAPVQQALVPAPGPAAATKAVAPKLLSPPAGAPPPAASVPAAPVPAAPVPVAPVVPVPVVVPPIAPAPVPPVHLPNPPASPPVVQAPPHPSPPSEPPPIHVPPPHSPPPHQTTPGQGPWPNPGGRPGGPSGNPGGGGPVNGPGPIHGNPGDGQPHGGGPINGPGPSPGTPTGGPPEGGGPPGAGPPPGRSGPVGGDLPPSGGETPGGGGPVGGRDDLGGGSHGGGGSSGSGETPGGGGPVGGGGDVGGGSHGGGGGDVGGGGGSGGGGSTGGGESGGGHR